MLYIKKKTHTIKLML